MNCRRFKNKLLRLTVIELENRLPTSLLRHMEECAPCAAEKDSLIGIIHNLRIGAKFNPPSDLWRGWGGLTALARVPDRNIPGWVRRLDWLLSPLMNLRTAAFGMAIVVVVIAVGAFFAHPKSTDAHGLPNRLVIAQRPLLINESVYQGISFKQGTHFFHPNWRTVTDDESADNPVKLSG